MISAVIVSSAALAVRMRAIAGCVTLARKHMTAMTPADVIIVATVKNAAIACIVKAVNATILMIGVCAVAAIVARSIALAPTANLVVLKKVIWMMVLVIATIAIIAVVAVAYANY